MGGGGKSDRVSGGRKGGRGTEGGGKGEGRPEKAGKWRERGKG